MKKYIKNSLFTMVTLSLMLSVLSIPLFSMNVEAKEKTVTDNGLELSKTAKDNGDGTYTISLEAYATGKSTTIEKTKPTDIVLVLDQSGSMNSEIVQTPHYDKVYGNGSGMDALSPGTIQYIQDSSTGKWLKVNKWEDEREVLHIGGVWHINPIYRDELGRRIVPLNKNNEKPVSNYESYQFHTVRYVGSGGKKIDVLKNAVNKFVESVSNNGGDHRIAVVGFASGSESHAIEPIYLNTELFIGDNEYNFNDVDTNTKYASAFQSVKTNKNDLFKSVSKLAASGATHADLGMKMANKILEDDPLANDKNRNKIIVMFTDGEPNSGGAGIAYPGFPDFHPLVADATINEALTTKQTHKAKVYTVGVVEDLDPSQNPALSSTNIMNRYMQYVSSNFPNASSLDLAGENGDYAKGNFLAVTDEESLLKIFDKISEDISSSNVELDEKTILLDVVSDYFSTGDAIDVKTYTSACTGKTDLGFTWGDKKLVNDLAVTTNNDQKTIAVSGFNYKDKFVAVNEMTGEPRGEKVIVEVVVSKEKGFLGGDRVNTNSSEAGIYADDTLFEAFPKPTVDVPLSYGFNVNDKSVYVGSTTTLASVFDTNETKEGIQYIGEDNNEYTFDGINNQFVDANFKVVNKDTGERLGSYLIKAGTSELITVEESSALQFKDTTNLEISATLKSATNEQNVLKSVKEAIINVFTPTLAIEDSSLFLGESTNLNANIKSVTWSCINALVSKPTDVEPTLSYVFSSNQMPIANSFFFKAHDTARYSVKVLNGTVDITDRTVKNNPITYQDGDFQIQVITGELTIEKEISKQVSEKAEINAEQSFKFKIEVRDTKEGEVKRTYYQSIQFSANENISKKSITLLGLEKGHYTVLEDSSWSWQYAEDASKRLDNYLGNGAASSSSENSSLFIGDKTAANTNGKTYYGSATGTMVAGVDQSNPAKTYFKSDRNAKSIISDVATAINKFKNR